MSGHSSTTSTDNKLIDIFNDFFSYSIGHRPYQDYKILALTNSDHSIIRLNIRTSKIQINNRMAPGLDKEDFYIALFNSMNCTKKFHNMNAHQMWMTFKNIIGKFQNNCVPLKEMRNAKTKKLNKSYQEQH